MVLPHSSHDNQNNSNLCAGKHEDLWAEDIMVGCEPGILHRISRNFSLHRPSIQFRRPLST